MEICANCGNTVPDGKKFCPKCGTKVEAAGIAPPIGAPPMDSPFAPIAPPAGSGLDLGMEIFDPKKDRRDPSAAPTGLGFSTESFEEAEAKAFETKKQAEGAARAASQKKKGAADNGEVYESSVDEALIEELLEESDKKKKFGDINIDLRTMFKSPVFYLAAGTLLLLPALLFPWFRFYEGEPLTAFRLPVVFLFADRVYAAPWLTVGVVVAAMFVIDIALTIYPRRIVTFMQIFAYISILLTIGGLLLGLRHWNAMLGHGPVYDTYLQNRQRVLPADPAPWLQIGKKQAAAPVAFATGAVRTPGQPPVGVRRAMPQRPPYIPRTAANLINVNNLVPPPKPMHAGANQKNIIGFFFNVLCIGFLFPLISGVVILWSTTKLATKMRHVEFQIPATVGALLIVLFVIAAALFLFARISPERWFTAQNNLYRKVGMNDAGDRKLALCIEAAAPDYLCRKALAKSYWEKGKTKDALALYMEVLKERPDFPDVHRDLGDFYYNGKNYWRAADHYKKYLRQRPSVAAVREKLSKCLTYIGNLEYGRHNYRRAARAYEDAIQTMDKNKNDPILRYKTGDAYSKLGRITDALVHLSASADMQPHDVELQIRVARMYEMKRNFDKALYYYKCAIDAAPDQTKTYIYIGNLYRNLKGDKTKAAEWYQKGIEANPVNDAVPEARQAIENLK